MSALDELEISAIRGGVDERVLNRARAERNALRSAASDRDAEVERALQAEKQLSDARTVINGLIAAIVMDSKDNNSISGYTGARLSDARDWEKRELERTAAIRARGENEAK